MKSIIIIGDGMSDYPIAKLGGRTPLMAAQKPNIDRIAREGVCGLFSTIPDGMPKGSAVANLSVLGYDPRETFQGRAVLEAASMGIELADDDVALRCNLVCIDDEGKIKNHSAGHISNEEAEILIQSLTEELAGGDDRPISLHPGVSYRHLLVLRGGWANPNLQCAPPHDHVGEAAAELATKARTADAAETAERVNELCHRAAALLADHPVNQARREQGKDPANAIWPWSPGVRPQMETFQERFGLNGAVISAVDLVRGLGRYAGMELILVDGATGLWDTNYEGKAAACLDALDDFDVIYVHVEATDEAGHARDLDLKIRCIEMLDSRLVGPILEGLESSGRAAIVSVLPDHPTPVETGKHASDPVPVAVWTPGVQPDGVKGYDESQVRDGDLGLLVGDQFIRRALGV